MTEPALVLEGVSKSYGSVAAACDLRLSIPGSGAVESLNVASATAVLLAAWWRTGAASEKARET